MSLADQLNQYFAADYEECWEHERTATPARALAVRSFSQDSFNSVSSLSLSRSTRIKIRSVTCSLLKLAQLDSVRSGLSINTDNLKIVIEAVESLLDELDERLVVTSDHDNCTAIGGG